jgi:hypothetical protein
VDIRYKVISECFFVWLNFGEAKKGEITFRALQNTLHVHASAARLNFAKAFLQARLIVRPF